MFFEAPPFGVLPFGVTKFECRDVLIVACQTRLLHQALCELCVPDQKLSK